MLDDLRSSALEEKKLEKDESESFELKQIPADEFEKKKILGMNPVQRFIIALLLLLVTCILGTACLLIFGKISFPF